MIIAMWSGPRNLSTAMMYAFGCRSDFTAVDEPFYAAYLAKSGVLHPMQAEILASQPTDPNKVAEVCVDPGPKPHKYLKVMPHHMLHGFPIDWARSCVNVHLIRHPARVIASYAAKRENPTLEDIGYPQQAALYDQIGGLVIDSHDIRKNPAEMLEKLCDTIGLSFNADMLAWPAGPKEFDGIWAPHWYGAVHQSTGFAGAEGPLPDLDSAARDLMEQALPHYEKLRLQKL